mmetsp:Transcript_127317/g.368625  ORF Transcript_127317/g.368625 Transcript_127317/m.368625 type:complete len:230 (-) Transcript_127317:1325-2014(-)
MPSMAPRTGGCRLSGTILQSSLARLRGCKSPSALGGTVLPVEVGRGPRRSAAALKTGGCTPSACVASRAGLGTSCSSQACRSESSRPARSYPSSCSTTRMFGWRGRAASARSGAWATSCSGPRSACRSVSGSAPRPHRRTAWPRRARVSSSRRGPSQRRPCARPPLAPPPLLGGARVRPPRRPPRGRRRPGRPARRRRPKPRAMRERHRPASSRGLQLPPKFEAHAAAG